MRMDVLMYASMSRFSSLRAAVRFEEQRARPRQASHDRFFMHDNVTYMGGAGTGRMCIVWLVPRSLRTVIPKHTYHGGEKRTSQSSQARHPKTPNRHRASTSTSSVSPSSIPVRSQSQPATTLQPRHMDSLPPVCNATNPDRQAKKS